MVDFCFYNKIHCVLDIQGNIVKVPNNTSLINSIDTVFILEHELGSLFLSIFPIQMSDQLESVRQKITKTGGEIDRINGLSADNSERVTLLPALPSFYANLAELRKEKNFLLEESKRGNDFVTRALGT